MEQHEHQSADGNGGRWDWLRGFAAVVTEPRQVLPLLGKQAGRVFVAALLMLTAVSVLTNWLYFRSVPIRQQFEQLVQQQLERYLERHPELSPEQQATLRQQLQQGMRFSLPRSLLGGVFSNTIALLSLAGLLWLVQPLVGVRWSALRFAVLVTALGYTSLWGAVGEIVAAALQVLGHSLQVQPSLAAFVVPEEQPVLFSVLSRIHLGALLQFGLLGTLLARAAEMALWRGMLWSAAAWGLWLGALYGMGVLVR